MTRRQVTKRTGSRLEQMRPDRRTEVRYLDWVTKTRLGRLANWWEVKYSHEGWGWKIPVLILVATGFGVFLRQLV